MPRTYEPIATQTLTGTVATVTFNSIPQTYTDLILVVQARSSTGGASDVLNLFLNNDGANIYSYTRLMGDGSTTSSGREASVTTWRINYNLPGGGATANVFGLDTIQLFNYSNTTTFKTALWRSNPAQILSGLSSNLYRSTGAITRMDLSLSVANFVSGSTFTLYGIKAA
jgi:hypothetical protein